VCGGCGGDILLKALAVGFWRVSGSFGWLKLGSYQIS
jgi:hypothetical protein